MTASSLHRRIISGEAGSWAMPVRWMLRAASGAYALGVDRRNRRFDRGEAVQRVAAAVLSVGNITVGGTGKTPMVMDLLHRLRRRRRTPAVVARGYKAAGDAPGDEERLIRRHAPDVCYIAAPDRLRGAAEALARGADVIVLDDGFQHRALARDLDIVLVDATCPFGFGYLLPRGLLREPASALQRADLVVITRSSEVASWQVARLRKQICQTGCRCPILSCCHRPVALTYVDGSALASEVRGFFSGKRVATFCGLARPDAFEKTVASCGGELLGGRRWPDHHRYTSGDIRSMLQAPVFRKADWCVTSEKDAVKLAELDAADFDRIAVLTVSIDFVGEDGKILDEALDRTLHRRGEK